MAIQQGINQLLGMTGTLAMLSPGLRASAEKRAHIADLKERVSGATGVTQAITKEVSESIASGDKERLAATMDISLETGEKGEALAKEAFELQPSEKSLKAYLETKKVNKSMQETISTIRADMEAKKKAEAMARMQGKGLAQVQQKKMFDQLIEDLSKAEKEGYNG